MTVDEFRAWLHRSKPGDKVEYWRSVGPGVPLRDHDRHLNRETLVAAGYKPPAAYYGAGAPSTWTWRGNHLVHLVRKRHGEDDYSYIAVRR